MCRSPRPREPLTVLAELRCDFGEPDDRLDSLDLTEEGTDVFELVVPPVLQEAGGLRSHVPMSWVSDGTPAVDLNAQLINDWARVVLL